MDPRPSWALTIALASMAAIVVIVLYAIYQAASGR